MLAYLSEIHEVIILISCLDWIVVLLWVLWEIDDILEIDIYALIFQNKYCVIISTNYCIKNIYVFTQSSVTIAFSLPSVTKLKYCVIISTNYCIIKRLVMVLILLLVFFFVWYTYGADLFFLLLVHILERMRLINFFFLTKQLINFWKLILWQKQ
jgi:hypothetical protein